jgi:2,4-dienoyl-CoA reductase-like NADH-dependent reductase (Old Yellow Enzyme family)
VYDNLFEPIQVAGTTIPNRIVRAAHGTYLGFPRRGDTDSPLIAYHVARARGGVGMSILETTPVHPSSINHGHVANYIPAWTDEVVDWYRKIADAVHPHGMKLFQQLWHGGHSFANTLGGPPWSASDVPNPAIGLVPVPMTKPMIDDVVAGYAATARRCKEGGLDGVEVHAAHGYLPAQFFSLATNHRDDEYGPHSFESRTRFCREVLDAIRTEVGPEFPVGVRLVADEEYDGGMVPAEATEIAKLLEPQVDFLNISVGTYYRGYKMLSTMDDPYGYEIPKTGPVSRAVTVPTILTGRIMTLDHASQLVAEGVTDMVSMVRALIADPDLVRKSRQGRAGEVRPCIGSSQGCIAHEEGHIGCVVNASAGFETTVSTDISDRAGVPKRVMIAGAGPSGLEAARAAALRGHEVFIYEMTAKIGGQVAIAASAPHRADVAGITGYLAGELERLGVKVVMRTFVEPELVEKMQPDVLIVAAGSTPRRDGFQATRPRYPLKGAELGHVYTSWDVFGFGGQAKVGERAVVYDDTGSYESICVSEHLLAKGADVTVVTRHREMAASVAGRQHLDLTAGPAIERLMPDPRFHLITNSHLLEITPTDVEVAYALGPGGPSSRHAADTVVFIGYNEPNRQLADALAGSGITVHVIGDAAGGRSLRGAIRDAALLVRGL